MAHLCRRVYEDQGARTSILAGAAAPRPDTLTQTGQITSQKPLADGAGHTFLNDRPRRSTADHIAPLLNRIPCLDESQDCNAAKVRSGWVARQGRFLSRRQVARPVTTPPTGAHLPGSPPPDQRLLNIRHADPEHRGHRPRRHAAVNGHQNPSPQVLRIALTLPPSHRRPQHLVVWLAITLSLARESLSVIPADAAML
jgi:hypothetical protein